MYANNGENELVTWWKFNIKFVLLCERSKRIACDKRQRGKKLVGNAWNEFLFRFVSYYPIYIYYEYMRLKIENFYFPCTPWYNVGSVSVFRQQLSNNDNRKIDNTRTVTAVMSYDIRTNIIIYYTGWLVFYVFNLFDDGVRSISYSWSKHSSENA